MPVNLGGIYASAQLGDGVVSNSKITLNTIAYDKLSLSTTESVNLKKRVAKAWVNFEGSTGNILSSFNIASLTRVSAGEYDIVFTVPMNDGNYVIVSSGGNPNGNPLDAAACLSIDKSATKLAGSVKMRHGHFAGSGNTGFPSDPSQASMVVFQ